jgi:formyl-CoA transferase
VQRVIADLVETRTTDEWLDFFEKADIPHMRVNDLDDLFDDPHLAATGFFTEREHPQEGTIRTTASPFAFEKTPAEYRHHAPALGADGRSVLGEAGFTDAEIADLQACGALRGG